MGQAAPLAERDSIYYPTPRIMQPSSSHTALPAEAPEAIGLLSLPDDLLLRCLTHLSQQER